MVTMIYAWFDGVMGMEITLMGYAVCVLAYFAACFLSRSNRAGKGKVMLGWLVCELSCDLLWYFCYFENGIYVNKGLAGSAACFILPVLLFTAGLIVSALNENEANIQKSDAD